VLPAASKHHGSGGVTVTQWKERNDAAQHAVRKEVDASSPSIVIDCARPDLIEKWCREARRPRRRRCRLWRKDTAMEIARDDRGTTGAGGGGAGSRPAFGLTRRDPTRIRPAGFRSLVSLSSAVKRASEGWFDFRPNASSLCIPVQTPESGQFLPMFSSWPSPTTPESSRHLTSSRSPHSNVTIYSVISVKLVR